MEIILFQNLLRDIYVNYWVKHNLLSLTVLQNTFSLLLFLSHPLSEAKT